MPFIACLNNVKTNHYERLINARVHYADLKQQPHQPPTTTNRRHQDKGRNQKLMLQDPTVCQTQPLTTPDRVPHPHHTPQGDTAQVVLTARTGSGQTFIDDSTSETPHCWTDIRCQSGRVLLRKEVIQPHLPVRLPCYDFVLIASPTFDGSLHKGWATGFGCCRLS